MLRPTGTVTLLFTDVEGSTRLWELDPAAAAAVMGRHDVLVRSAIEAHGGYVFAGLGDGFASAFGRASDAVAAAIEAQRALACEAWPASPVRVRMGLHTGEAVERDGDYFGPAVNRAARIMAAGHGGQVLMSAVTAGLVEDVETVALGEHQLRDVARGERIHQVVAPGLVLSFPPLRAGHETAHNLPSALTSFVGRGGELGSLVEAVTAHRLVTLVGVGGAGKTRLAVEGARRLLTIFSDGVWLVELAPLRDHDAVPSAVAQAMGRHDPLALSDGPLGVSERLASAVGGEHALVVLDNCEHLLEPCAELVAMLLARCPNLGVLATSREGLGASGEHLLAVGALELPVADDVDAVAHSAAGSLFMERAAAVRPGFTLTSDTAGAVAALCRRLDGLPLALELTAARVRVLSPAQIINRLDDAFGVLGGGHTAVKRHETLRAALGWSYELLGDAEQALFRRLAVCRGGFTLEAAEALGVDLDGEALELLASLIDKSLVVATDGHGGARRFHLLEIVRQFAWSQLEEHGESDGARELQRDHLLTALADSESSRGRGPVAFRVVAAEVDNVRAAVGWSLQRGDPETALALATSFHFGWLDLGLLREEVDLLLSCLEAVKGKAAPAPALANAMWDASINLAWFGEFDRAAALGHDLGTLAEQHPALDFVQGAWHFAVATIDYLHRDGDLSYAHSQMAAAQTAFDAAGYANPYPAVNELFFAVLFDEVDESWFARIVGEGLDRARRGDVPVTASTILFLEASPAMVAGDHTGRSRCEQHLERLLELGSGWDIEFMVFIVGLGREVNGDLPGAAEATIRVLDFCRRSGLRFLLPGGVRGAARLVAAAGLAPEAARLFGAADGLEQSSRLRQFPLLARLDQPHLQRCRDMLGGAATDQLTAHGRRWTAAEAAERAERDLLTAASSGALAANATRTSKPSG